ncbi:TRAP transporter substrate-binding protein [Billgrantia aerodenitrificans]|uniref:TRAP transporter substrate-binding protein n=1 Tax=Billgrantia aerodenitrificans TaxID=2733483 RepID=A0ABS9AMY2_9GAMM|nr:TRAP transporter substrate-binding protein [Halomonas aerodenitrificans]MCE8023201.1 TRAP transporter substrate-binding protein [Halomonas aerodenitrificans]
MYSASERKKHLKSAVVFGLVASFFGASASALAVERATLQLATIASPDNLWYEAAQRFSDGVAERTDGNVKIEIAHSGTTGSVRESVEALQIGANDIVQTVIASLEPYDDIAAIESYPYLFRDADHFLEVFSGSLGDEIYQEISNKTGFTLIGAGYRGAREMASKRPVESVDDLSGLRIRVPEIRIFRKTWEILGASPIPMGSGEVYTGLQQGIIDAVENPLEAHLRSRYHEAADYVVMTGHVHSAYTFLFDNARFESFSPELQEILREEGRNAMEWGSQESLKQIAELEAELERLGVTIIRPNLDEFREKIQPMVDEFPHLAPWVERISADT